MEFPGPCHGQDRGIVTRKRSTGTGVAPGRGTGAARAAMEKNPAGGEKIEATQKKDFFMGIFAGGKTAEAAGRGAPLPGIYNALTFDVQRYVGPRERV